MKEIFIIFELNTWSEPASWDVCKIFNNRKKAEDFLYKDWPRNSRRYQMGTYKVEG